MALCVGFAGVLIVIRPGTELFHWASLLVVVSAAGYAVYQVLTRLISTIDPPETSAIYSSIVGGFGMFAGAALRLEDAGERARRLLSSAAWA